MPSSPTTASPRCGGQRPGAVALLTALGLVLALLAGCSSSGEDGGSSGAAASGDSWLADHELDGLDARQIIDRLDRMPVAERPEDLMASVRPETLELSDATGNRSVLPMPEDAFYLSIAPYTDQTHECFFHSLTTCLGELDDTDVTVTVTDSADDSEVLRESVRTFDNGFAGVWLPRGLDAVVTVDDGRRSASTPISTGDDGATCLTTLQLT